MKEVAEVRPSTFPQCKKCKFAGQVIKKERHLLVGQEFSKATINIRCHPRRISTAEVFIEPVLETRRPDKSRSTKYGGLTISACPGMKAWR
ncbi:hypothetical protein A2115_02905 [Candidatus Woesebacteria bacterium GWA1_41_8]|uniref:Uncharacterized protein n=1 Tax=Candidatus Woesebacteria bacterium GWA1_41_8 TaxID=1802471 RepID=A0A1F7WJ04_9BACT|nr:MAG: hypothetical protein A2115_02905 [Candidatus Woesebacteria bacterium GWA1_41_8]